MFTLKNVGSETLTVLLSGPSTSLYALSKPDIDEIHGTKAVDSSDTYIDAERKRPLRISTISDVVSDSRTSSHM